MFTEWGSIKKVSNKIMGEIKRIFKSENVRVGFDKSADNRVRILIVSKDRGFTKYDRWVINHLSVSGKKT